MKILFSVLLCFVCLNNYAQTIHNFNTINGNGGLNPSDLTNINNNVYFFAEDANSGREIWVVNSTTAPKLFLDVIPGSSSGIGDSAKKCFALLNGMYYFTAYDPVAGYELFQYDGTNSPQLAVDVYKGPRSSHASYFTVFNNKLYFLTRDTNSTVGSWPLMDMLWEYNPATGITRQLSQNNDPWIVTNPPLMPFNNKLFFVANVSTSSTSLRLYDPVPDTCGLAPGAFGGSPFSPYVYGNSIFFQGESGTSGYDLFSYNGSNLKNYKLTSKGIQMQYSSNNIFIKDDILYASIRVYTPSPPIHYDCVMEYDLVNDTILTKIFPVTATSFRANSFQSLNGKLYTVDLNSGKIFYYNFSDSLKLPDEGCTGCNYGQANELIRARNTIFFSSNSTIYGKEICKLEDTSKFISKPLTDSVFCSSANFNIKFSASIYDPGNVFTAELSDSNGSFASPVTIGTFPSIVEGNINCTIPASVPFGHNYRIRITSSSPARTSDVSRTIRIGNPKPEISLAATPGTVIVPGTPVYFATTISYGGNNPVYAWAKNGSIINGASNDSYASSLLKHNDIICAILLSNDVCASPVYDTACLGITYTNVRKLAKNSLQIFPNPSTGNFMIRGSLQASDGTFTISDLQGRVVYLGTISSNILDLSINLQNAPDGVYVLKLQTDKEQIVTRLVLRK